MKVPTSSFFKIWPLNRFVLNRTRTGRHSSVWRSSRRYIYSRGALVVVPRLVAPVAALVRSQVVANAIKSFLRSVFEVPGIRGPPGARRARRYSIGAVPRLVAPVALVRFQVVAIFFASVTKKVLQAQGSERLPAATVSPL